MTPPTTPGSGVGIVKLLTLFGGCGDSVSATRLDAPPRSELVISLGDGEQISGSSQLTV